MNQQLDTIITELRGMREDLSAITFSPDNTNNLVDAAVPFASKYNQDAMGDLEGYTQVQITVTVGQLRSLIAAIAEVQ